MMQMQGGLSNFLPLKERPEIIFFLKFAFVYGGTAKNEVDILDEFS